MYRLNVGEVLIFVIGMHVGHSSLHFSGLVTVDVFEDVFESLRPVIEVFEHFVWFLDFTAVLPDAVDAFQILGRAAHCVARVFVVFTGTDHLSDEWILEDAVAGGLVVDSLEHGVLIGPGNLEYLQYVKPQIFDLCRALVDQIEVVPDRD